jgi:hypothetical protein
MTLAEREQDITELEEAVAAFRASLEERTPTRTPLDWAMTQSNLALALETMAVVRRDPVILSDAISCLNAALSLYSKENAKAALETAERNMDRMKTRLRNLSLAVPFIPTHKATG